MKLEQTALEQVAEKRFRVYCDAAHKAQASHRINDAYKAGMAWREFLDCFVAGKPVLPDTPPVEAKP